ncbi:MAG: SCO family protein [Proteobacteria bacterium]|nr:SCO family protein [Pseudomonadota bacterium]
MTLSPRARMIAGFVLANTAIFLVAGFVLLNRPASPPSIQGVLLPDARDLPPFSLLDHHHQAFINEDLLGQWHLVSYGFTTCPDICPTTLAELARLKTRLAENGEQLRVLFYSVDHQRDTPQQLASYMPFFHADFVGLTYRDGNDDQHLPFEEGLGIAAQLIPDEDDPEGSYQVVHGVTLFLLNPQGQLQAILKPGLDRQRNKAFDADTIYKDFLLLRDYFG